LFTSTLGLIALGGAVCMKHLRFQQKKGGCSLLGRTVCFAAVLLVGVLIYLSADPEAHGRLHPDADHCDHTCVLTAFAAGEGLYIVPRLEVRPAESVVRRVHFQTQESLRNSPDFLLLPICGPPSPA